eukprot:2145391-Rhodomonas_salina.1
MEGVLAGVVLGEKLAEIRLFLRRKAADHDLIRDQYAVSVPDTAQGLRSPDRYATSVLGIAQRTCRPLDQMRSQRQAPPSARVGL